MYLTESQVSNYLQNAGFKGTALIQAVQISRCESDFNTNAHNTAGEDSRGIMQINVNAHPEYIPLDLFNPAVNAMVAFEVYRSAGYSFRDWTCYRLLGLSNKEKTMVIAGLALVTGIVLYYV